MDSTAYFPQWRAQIAPLGRQLQRVRETAGSLSGLAALFEERFGGLLRPAVRGVGSRQRDLPRVLVFWAFLAQVLRPEASCRSALARLQAEALARGRTRLGDSTSAYCQARAALPLQWLQALFLALDRWFQPRICPDGPQVRFIDGTGFSMPDTEANRKKWPYAGRQKPGCGFPVGKLVGLFCAQSGRLLRFTFASWKTADVTLARRLLSAMRPADILLADRAFCSWWFLAQLRSRQVHFVMRLHQSRKKLRRARRSWREVWPRCQRPQSVSAATWQRYPTELVVRLVRWPVHRRGWRTKHVHLVTSLLDHHAYPNHAIAQLYLRRWEVELHFRQIKCDLGLDVLRGRSPAMIAREIWMHALAYNLVRALLLDSARTHRVPIQRLSFKGALDALLNWDRPLTTRRGLRLAYTELLRLIAAHPVPFRPHRTEPRARKRRPSGSYQLLTRPRHQMRVSPSRYR